MLALKKQKAGNSQIADAAGEDFYYPKATPLQLGLLALVILIKYTQLTSRFPALADMRFELIVNAILFFIVAFKAKPYKISNPIVGAVVFLYLCIAIQVPLSVNIDFSWNVFVDHVVKYSIFAYLIANIILSPKNLRLFWIFFLLSCGKIAQEGFMGWLTGGLVWENQGVMRLNGSVPIYGSPNSFSGFGVGLIPFLYYLSPLATRYEKFFLAAIAVGATVIIIFTASRTGYMGTIAFFLYAVMRSQAKMKALVLLIVIATAAAFFVPADYKDRFMSSFTGQDKEGGSTRARKQILVDAKEIFFEHPLGIGVAAFPLVRMQKFGRFQDTHNLYMEVLTNLGIQGGIAFVIYIVSLFRLLAKTQKMVLAQLQKLSPPGRKKSESANSNKSVSDPNPMLTAHTKDLQLIVATTNAVMGFIVVRLVLGMFGMDMYEIYWWFMLGLALACYRITVFAEKRTDALMLDPQTNKSIQPNQVPSNPGTSLIP